MKRVAAPALLQLRSGMTSWRADSHMTPLAHVTARERVWQADGEDQTMEGVIIVGGGPTGLMLACELQLAGTRAMVIELLPKPTGLSKALGLAGRAVDLLEHRGLLERFVAHQPVDTDSIAGLFHFGGIPIDVRRLKGSPPKFL